MYRFFNRNLGSLNIAVEMTGQTGNQMFGLLAAISQAKRLNCNLELDFSHVPNRLSSFVLRNDISLNLSAPRTTYTIFEESASHVYDEAINSVSKNTILKGYFQNWRYFENLNHAEIRDLFRLKNPSNDFASLKNKFVEENTLAIHIRCYEAKHRNYHGVIPLEYLEKSFSLVTKLREFQQIVVFTDNKEETAEILNKSAVKPDLIIDPERIKDPAESLILMSLAKVFIGSNSSFSWWGAFLSSDSSRTTVFPRPWYKNHDNVISSQYLPNWITLGFTQW